MAITASSQQLAVANLYTALFNRAPDAAGMTFWTQALSRGVPLGDITQLFLAGPEAKAIFPIESTAEAFVAGFYERVLGHVPDPVGLAFWTASLNAAGGAGSDAAKASFLSQIVNVISAPLAAKPADITDAQYAQTVADRTAFGNKVVMGVYYAIELGGTNVELARQVLAGVNSSSASVDAARSIAKGTASAPAAPAAPAVLPLNLAATTDIDTLVGTSGNDRFTATHLTLSALDSIDGGAGIDTLDYVNASTTFVPVPNAQVQNVEIINIRNVNTADFGYESFLVRMLAALRPGQTLSVAGLTLTGAAEYAMQEEVSSAFLTGTTVGNALMSGVLDAGYRVSVSESSIIFTATTPGNKPDLVVEGSAAMTTDSYVTQGTQGATLTVPTNMFVGATNFNADRATVSLSLAGLTAGQAVGVIGDNTVAGGSIQAIYQAGVTSATLNLLGGVRGKVVEITDSGSNTLTSVTITSTGSANSIAGVQSLGPVTSLLLDATTDLSIDLLVFLSLRQVSVRGTATIVKLIAAGPDVTTFDASGLTMGGVSIYLSGSVRFTGGAGNDTVSLGANGVFAGTADAGGGSGDVLVLYTGSSLTAATGPRFTNFDILRLASNYAGDAQTFDTSLLSGIQSYQIAAAAVPGTSSVTLDQLADGAAIAFLGNHGNVTLNLVNATSASDVLNVTLGNDVTSNGALTNGVQVTLIAPGVETINLHSVGTVGGTGVNTLVNDVGTNTTLSKMVIDGTQPLSLQLQALAQALTVDASALAGTLDVQGTAATQFLNVTGGTASDTIVGGRAGGLIVGGAGGESTTLYSGGGVDTLAYLSAADSRQDFVNASGTAASTQDAISNFATGVDKIDLKALALDAAVRSFVTKTYASTAALLADEALADFYLDGGAVAAKVGADTYLVVDANGDHLFNATTDLVVKLNGVSTLAQGDIVYA